MAHSILLTGANGQLGRRLLPRLLANGHAVRAHYRTSEKAAKYCPSNATPIVGDFANTSWLDNAVSGCDIVIHAAARVSLRAGGYSEQYQTNVVGTQDVVTACIKNYVGRMLNISSIVTIGASTSEKPIDETAPFNLGKYNIPYIITKRKGEDIALAANGSRLEVISLNPSIMISPPDRVVTQSDLNKIPHFLPAYIDFGLNLVETDDVIDGIIAAIDKGRPGERYLLTGENLTPDRVFMLTEKYLGIRKPPIKIPIALLYFVSIFSEAFARIRGRRAKLYRDFARLGYFRFIYSNEKARHELGFSPRPLVKTIESILSKIPKAERR
jgi:dihydroflavonol-4-reductase